MLFPAVDEDTRLYIYLEARGNSYFPQLINAAWFGCQDILLSSATYCEMFRI
jgi:hypothetical protein